MDRELVESAQVGDRSAFVDLIRPRVDRLFALAQGILRDVDRVEDALQDALVMAWRGLPGLRFRTGSTPGSTACSRGDKPAGRFSIRSCNATPVVESFDFTPG